MAVTRLRDGLILMANRACLEFLGWEAADFIGRTTEDVGLWADPSQRAPMAERLRADGRIRDLEANLRTKSGETRRVLTSIELVEVGTEPGLLGIFYDITERAALEAAVRETEARFQAFFDNAPTVINLKDPDLRFRLVNRRMAEVLHLPAGDLIGMTARDIYSESIADVLEAGDHRVLDERETVSLEHDLPMPAGEPRTFRFLKFPILSHDGEVTGIGTIATDITEARMAQRALAESEERFRQLTESIDTAFILRSAEPYEFLYASPVLQKLTGLSPEELADPNSIFRIVHPDDRQIFIDRLSGGRAEDVFDVEHRIIRPDGATRWMRARAWPVRREEGRVTRVAATYEDITDRKEAELAVRAARAEADRANLAKSDFLSRMSHELRTPLNAVLGFSELLSLADLPPEKQEAVGQIQKAGRHLLALVDDVLDISRIETGDINLSLEPVSLPDVVREAVELVRPLGAARGVAIGESVGCDGYVLADLHRLRQVLLNLLSNGVKYNRPGGRVSVSCEPQGPGRIRIAVTDTGMGIAEADINRLFTPFDRLGGRHTEVEGTGLGLALSKGLVEAMNGTMGAESNIGSGSTFWIDLATADASAISSTLDAREPRATPSSVPLTGTVLYIEDNISNLLLVEGLVALRPGVDLLSAMQGALGLELAAARRPDLVLLDLHLPDLPGEKVLERLRAEPVTADIPIVVLSADATRRQIDRLIAAGATDYLTKPFEVQRLLGWIDRALAHGVPSDAAAGPSSRAKPGREVGRAREGGSDAPALDPGQIASLRELDGSGEALRRLANLFLADTPVKVEQLSRAVAAGDADSVATAAHDLKGSAGILGAKALIDAADAIESIARKDGLPGAAAVTRLQRAADAAVAGARSLVNSAGNREADGDAAGLSPSSISAE